MADAPKVEHKPPEVLPLQQQTQKNVGRPKRTPDDQAEYFYNQPKMHRLMFISSFLLLFSLVLMFADDFWGVTPSKNRHWKDYQATFQSMELARLQSEIQEIEEKIESAGGELEKIDRQIALKERELEETDRAWTVTIKVMNPATLKKEDKTYTVRLPDLEKQRAALLGEYQLKQQKMNFDKSEYMTVRYQYEEAEQHLRLAREQKDPRIPHFEQVYQRALQKWNDIQKRVQESKAAFDEVDDRMSKIEDQIAAVKKPLMDLKAARIKMMKDLEDRLLRLNREKPQLANAIRNAPMLDFFDPTIKVQQQVIPAILNDMNFAKVEKVDRCHTCHRGIDNLDYEVDVFPDREKEEDRYVFHKAPLRLFVEHARGRVAAGSCKICKGAADGKMIVTTAHGSWGADEVVKYTKSLMAHPKLELYAGATSPHPLDRVGCTTCHEGDGMDTEFSRVVHMPDTDVEKKAWERRHHYHYRHLWDSPMLPMRHIYSSCRRCHSREVEVSGGEDPMRGTAMQPREIGLPAGDDYIKGMILYERAGCYACHRTDSYQILPKDTDPDKAPNLDPNRKFRRPGPPLTHIKDKVDPNWAVKWVLAPKSFRLSTRMPHFFGQSNARTIMVDGAPVGPERVEPLIAASMVKYLFEVSQSRAYKPPPPPPQPADAKRGLAVFEQIGCRACHTNTPDSEYAKRKELRNDDDGWRAPTGESWLLKEFGPNLSGVASKFRDDPERGRVWFYNWLKQPKHYFAATRMPAFPLTEQDLHDVTAWLMTLTKEGDFDQKPGMPAFDAADHKILDTLIFEQLRSKLPDADAKTALDAMRTKPPEKVLWFGRKMVQNYGCYSCHEMWPEKDKGPDPLLDRLPIQELAVNWPDIEGVGVELTGSQPEGNKAVDRLAFGYTEYDGAKHHGVKFEHAFFHKPYKHLDPEDPEPEVVKVPEFRHLWIRNKLFDPRVFDGGRLAALPPDELLKMPNFYLNPEEVRLLTTFVLSFTNHDFPLGLLHRAKKQLSEDQIAVNRGHRLIRESNCRACHRFALDKLEVEWKRVEPVNGIPKEVTTYEWIEGNRSGKVDDDTKATLLTKWGIWPAEPGPQHLKMDLYTFQWTSDGCTLKLNGAVNPNSLFVLVNEGRAEYLDVRQENGNDVVKHLDVRRWKPMEGGEILGHIEKYKKDHVDDIVDKKGNPAYDPDNPQAVFSRFPPMLRTQGAKTQAAWLFGFLKDPTPIRPALVPIVPDGQGPPDQNVRMPNFGFSDEEAASLVGFFWARDRLAGEESHPFTSFPERDPVQFAAHAEDLRKAETFFKRTCGECHYWDGRPPEGTAMASYKFAPELAMAEDRLRPRWLYPWLRQPSLIYPGTPMTAMDQSYKEIGGGEVDPGLRKTVEYLMNFNRLHAPPPKAASPDKPDKPDKKDK